MKISVVIPTHNRAELLLRAVNSVLNQTYKDIEAVVVSDGSTDKTDEIMEQFKNDERVLFFSYYPSKGANYARNYGVSRSRGDIIAFLDDDDEWKLDKAEKQIKVFDDRNIGIVTSGMHFIYVKNKSSSDYLPNPPYDCKKSILLKNILGGTPAIIVKKDVFLESGGFDENLSALQDYDMWVRICQITKVGVVCEPLVNVYDYFDPNKISNKTNNYIEAYNYITKKYSALISKLSTKETSNRNYNFYTLIAKKGLRNNDRRVAKEYAIKAFRERKSMTPILVILASLVPYSFTLKIRNIFG